jgi:hypothetical protein
MEFIIHADEVLQVLLLFFIFFFSIENIKIHFFYNPGGGIENS